jgi:hypothetical protein
MDPCPVGRTSTEGRVIRRERADPLQIRSIFSYNRSSSKDKKWARRLIFFCFFGFGA